MQRDLITLTAFPDRYAGSQHGVKAAAWIKTRIENIMTSANYRDGTLKEIDTRWTDHQGHITHYPQPSLVFKLGNSKEPGVVIGAHIDTTKGYPRPGADDDGSGTVTLLEMARILTNSHTTFKKPIYLIWYGAEEDDLDGSKSVVNYFIRQKIPVAAVMQLDMTGKAYHHDSTLWLSDTGHYRHVDRALTDFTYHIAKK